jgi:exosortase
MTESPTATAAPPSPPVAVTGWWAMPWFTIALPAGLLLWSYWPGLMVAAGTWSTPQYSHGWLVPLFAAAVVAWRWTMPSTVTAAEQWAGLIVLGLSLAVRLVAARYRIVTIDMYTLVPALLGVVIMAGGVRLLRRAGPPVAFLIFMYPLPDEATRYLLGPLQTLATIASTYLLQTLGFEAFREGNQIVLGDSRLGVVDACSGLRMLTIFVALAVGWALVDRVAWWERLAIIASAIPVALAVNVARITATGMMMTVSEQIAEQVFHDWAGYVMMPLAMALLVVVRWLLAAAVIEDLPVAVPVIDVRGRRPEGRP